MPNFARMSLSKHHLVMPLWNRFEPTKAVNHKKFLLTKSGLVSTPSVNVNKIKVPATIRTIRSAFMVMLLKIITDEGLLDFFV